MIPFILILGGILMVWIGGTDIVQTTLDLGDDGVAPGYPNIPFPGYMIAAVLVSLPLVLIEESNKWAWKYVILILVMAVVTNYEGIAKFSQDLSDYL